MKTIIEKTISIILSVIMVTLVIALIPLLLVLGLIIPNKILKLLDKLLEIINSDEGIIIGNNILISFGEEEKKRAGELLNKENN